jgi:hypothetical protein
MKTISLRNLYQQIATLRTKISNAIPFREVDT